MELFVTVNFYCKVSHLRCSSSPRSASEKSYSKCNIPFQLINNCNNLMHFISLVWLFLNLGPTITWNWKLKQWNIRRLLTILTLNPVAYNLRHFLRFIFSFPILSLLTYWKVFPNIGTCSRKCICARYDVLLSVFKHVRINL